MNDGIEALKKYIENNLGESSGCWEYVLHPNIRDYISNLNQTDSEKFSIEILNWNEDVLYQLADEMLFSNNEYIDKDYLFCSIYLIINDIENLDYLSQYIIPCFKNLNFEKVSLEFFLQMKEKMKNFYIIKNGEENVDNFIRQINEVINKKMQTTENK
ncbi:hypothetical protein J2Y38_000896 [Flavobacterium sp. 2755]|uniref:hypothetical protein n=1 Tax=Flavobacterium sp. 2755 TaxID=2817765 RepID=UPI0028578341|nr:hypothetical protein [Flavobacterium sp. 2755]MDR6760698.1 hypothetical protein [Flavobacterium sp. 2755]